LATELFPFSLATALMRWMTSAFCILTAATKSSHHDSSSFISCHHLVNTWLVCRELFVEYVGCCIVSLSQKLHHGRQTQWDSIENRARSFFHYLTPLWHHAASMLLISLDQDPIILRNLYLVWHNTMRIFKLLIG